MVSAASAQTCSTAASRLRPESAASATSAEAQGEPLISDIASRESSTVRDESAPKRWPSAMISPLPPLPCAGTVGSGSVSSIPATARASSGRTPELPSIMPVRRVSTIPRTTRSGSGSPKDAPERPSMRASLRRCSASISVAAPSPALVVTP